MKPGTTVAEFRTSDERFVTIRSLKYTDLDAMVEFANKLVKDKRTNRDLGIVSFDRRMTHKEEREFLKMVIEGNMNGDVVSLGAFAGGNLVGHCDLKRRKPADVRHSGVLGIVVLEGYRGVGLGEKLLTEVLGEAQRRGVWLVELTVFAINERAIHLYEKLGFRRVGIVPDKMHRDGRYLDEVAMYVDLRGSDKSPTTARGKR